MIFPIYLYRIYRKEDVKMGLLGLGKKKEVKDKSCCCGGDCNATAMEAAKQVVEGAIKVLGFGCAKCNELEANTKAALAN